MWKMLTNIENIFQAVVCCESLCCLLPIHGCRHCSEACPSTMDVELAMMPVQRYVNLLIEVTLDTSFVRLVMAVYYIGRIVRGTTTRKFLESSDNWCDCYKLAIFLLAWMHEGVFIVFQNKSYIYFGFTLWCVKLEM
uniref:Uncharacterized protein n=1 Tax=Romanomermis culicivorax TaxID=13658 RepID=A0A915K2J7_ROMCU